MSATAKRGAFPTMVTPYNKDGSVDWGAVEAITRWYWRMGCAGVFASCQSSEIWTMTEDERVGLARVVMDTADALARQDKSRPPMTVVASGHVSDAMPDQVRELTRIAETGVDAVILITNRMDVANTGDEAWIAQTDALVRQLPAGTALGLYECPHPYKRLLTPAMLRYAAQSGRFKFIKDTCCDAQLIAERVRLLEGSGLLLYNANSQTMLPALQAGAAGFCGIMGNFHPQLYNWLVENFDTQPEKARFAAAMCTVAAFTDNMPYPVTAKYHLKEIEGLPLHSISSRVADEANFTPYHAACVRQLDELICETVRQLEL